MREYQSRYQLNMDAFVISSDSSDDEIVCISDSYNNLVKENHSASTVKHRSDNNTALPPKAVKRIKPTLISPNISKQKMNEDADDGCFIDESNDNVNPITESFARLLDVCRLADPSSDMDQLIKIKLMKFYHMVKPEFINSKTFQEKVSSTINEIQSNPKLAYLKLTVVLAELYYEHEDEQNTSIQDDASSSDDSRRENKIERLNKAFDELDKKIHELETSEVDLADEENSTFILIEKYKKRACEIHQKIAELNGEKKSIYRRFSKPILNTKYEKFNKAVQTYLKKTGNFPNLRDVVKILEFCNRKHKFELREDEIKVISEDAFVVIGKTLQKQRKLELYKTLNFYTEGVSNDPAIDDAALRSKLNENRKHYSSVNNVINKYAAIQEKSPDISNPKTSNVGKINKNKNNDKGPIPLSEENELGIKEKEAGQKLATDNPSMLVIILDDE